MIDVCFCRAPVFAGACLSYRMAVAGLQTLNNNGSGPVQKFVMQVIFISMLFEEYQRIDEPWYKKNQRGPNLSMRTKHQGCPIYLDY